MKRRLPLTKRSPGDDCLCKREQHFFDGGILDNVSAQLQQSYGNYPLGRMGKLMVVRSDFAFKAAFDPQKRLYNVALGGGSLLDIGIYPVFAALTSLGKPETIKAFADFSPTGSEESITILFKYREGEMAVSHPVLRHFLQLKLNTGLKGIYGFESQMVCAHQHNFVERKW